MSVQEVLTSTVFKNILINVFNSISSRLMMERPNGSLEKDPGPEVGVSSTSTASHPDAQGLKRPDDHRFHPGDRDFQGPRPV